MGQSSWLIYCYMERMDQNNAAGKDIWHKKYTRELSVGESGVGIGDAI